MRTALVVLAGAVLVVTGAEAVTAQSLGNVIKREAERETKRQAQRRTREAVQCATGARDCLPKEEAGADGDAPSTTVTAAQSGSAAERALFSVPPIAGATAVDHQAGTMSSYRRITGFRPKLISYADHTGLLTRTRYDLTGGQTPSAMITAWREPLLRQGFVVEWQCSRKAQCGSSAYHQLGAGYVPVNGINLGIAGDVEYFTARRTVENEPTVYVAIALNRNVAYVDVIEVAP
ncbi:hypothetical protein [Porphyrobacter sp. YT40]|uniref:hypothetical protein n=1 Tax=Porphyrobacter sp. YT40 TaxID=2547601 RepID=UPI001141FCE4|nr:hypothetical protein [Porphyrobacter sp. YT40]QDH35775.1 hypothetical protein E2E27_16515 [Porphyrobacter sp. YT40]